MKTEEEIRATILMLKRAARGYVQNGNPDLAVPLNARADALAWVIGAGRWKLLATNERKRRHRDQVKQA